ncbi:MAG: hypothetical protein NW203_15815 [Hyphomonadaceae bacterium]|nr:hypothetical protein [Hyphomonadaceae bacterium]
MRGRAALAAALAASCALPAAAQTGSRPTIEVGALRPLDLWSVSAIGQRQGALPATLWSGSDAAFLGALFDRLAAAPDSPAALALARRALASSADAPEGAAASEAARKRFAALGRMGFADDLAVMAAGAGGAANDPGVAQYVAQAELARADLPAACRRAAGAVGADQPAFILRLRALCAASAGDHAAAALALEVARAAGGADAWFDGVVAHMGAPAARAPVGRFDNSLNAAASLAAGLQAGPNPLANASTLALLAVARADRAPAPLRAQAAALAFRRGVMDAASARAAIRAAFAAPAPGLPPLAETLRQVEAAPGSPAASAALAALLRRSTAYADFAAAARLFRDDIAALTSAPDAASALVFWRAALAADDGATAQRLAAAAQDAGLPAAAQANLVAAIGARRGDPDAIARRLAAGGPAAPREAAILAAAGLPLDAAQRAQLAAAAPTGGRRPDAALIAALDAAAAAGAVGETALLASALIADGAHLLDTDGVCDVIRALRQVGLDDAARSVAVEALIGANA